MRCTNSRGHVIHILAILYTVKSDEDFHLFLNQIDKKDAKLDFLDIIKPLSNLILDAGLINQAVAQIDMIGDLTPDEVSSKEKEILISKGVDIKSEEKYIKANFKKSSFVNYHYSGGHHREWLTNSEMFDKLILE